MVASRLFRGFMYNLVQSFLIEINTFMFSHFTDGKTGTETVSTVLEVTASKRNEEASAGRGPTHRCEPVPAPGPRVREGAPALARRRRLASGLSFKERETQPWASACRVDGKHRLTRRARNMRPGSTCLGPSRPRSDLVCSWDSRL